MPSIFVRVRMRASYGEQMQLSPQDSSPPLLLLRDERGSLPGGALVVAAAEIPKENSRKPAG